MVKGASFLVRVYPLYGHLNWQVMSRVCVCVCVRTSMMAALKYTCTWDLVAIMAVQLNRRLQ